MFRSLGPHRLPAAWRRVADSPPPAPPQANADGASETEPVRLARLEAALFLAAQPLPLRRLSKAAGLGGVAEVRKLLAVLKSRLANRGSAVEVVEVAGGVCLRSRAALAPWLERFFADKESRAVAPKMGPAVSETLAIVAYRQPVVRAEVEAIRGVGCGEVLRQLLEAGLLRIVGRSEELGRPLLYGTSDRFLEVYGLGSLDDLPARDEGTDGACPTQHNAATDRAA